MLRRRHQSAFHRVVVQILKLLQHDFIANHCLRMRAFLPNLMPAGGLVGGPEILQLVKEPVTPFSFQLPQDLARRKFLQLGNCVGKVGAGEKGVEVVVEDDPGMDLKRPGGPAVEQRS